jgi:hypothetical protein
LRVLLRKRAKVGLVGIVVACGAAAALALGPAGLAVGQSSPPVEAQLQVNSPATLGANGTSVDVSVTASCAGEDSTTVQVTLTEAVNGDIASGVGNGTVDCTGTSQTVEVPVLVLIGTGTATPPEVPSQDFTNGPAIAVGLIQACDADFNCALQQPERVIKIQR